MLSHLEQEKAELSKEICYSKDLCLSVKINETVDQYYFSSYVRVIYIEVDLFLVCDWCKDMFQ